MTKRKQYKKKGGFSALKEIKDQMKKLKKREIISGSKGNHRRNEKNKKNVEYFRL